MNLEGLYGRRPLGGISYRVQSCVLLCDILQRISLLPTVSMLKVLKRAGVSDFYYIIIIKAVICVC